MTRRQHRPHPAQQHPRRHQHHGEVRERHQRRAERERENGSPGEGCTEGAGEGPLRGGRMSGSPGRAREEPGGGPVALSFPFMYTLCTHGVNYILSTGIIAFYVLGTSGDIASQ